MGEYIGVPDLNSWTVSGGEITSYSLLAFGVRNSSPDVTCCSLHLDSGVQDGTGLSPRPDEVGFDVERVADIVFTPVSGAVPEAPTWAMLVLGFAGLAAAGRMSRRFNVARAS